MQPTIFISREEVRCQEFIDVVKLGSSAITCTSLIDFSIIKAGHLPDEGWLFFYSQTGVDYFLKQFDLSDVQSKDLKIAAFGPKTGRYIRERNLKVDFIGNGEAKATAALFLLKESIPSVCFVKGSASKDSLRPLLNTGITLSSLEVYHNIGKQHLELPLSDILVFTSPLNLETYYKHYSILTNQKVVAIGTSTAMSALNIGLEEVHISQLPSLESLAALVVQLCDTWSHTK